MFSVAEIADLSREDKLRAMEALWQDLTRYAEDIESPGWHRGELERTARRRAEGKESPLDWQAAKQELRNRFA